MSDRPPLPVLVLRPLLVLAFEASLLAWGLGGYAALAGNPRALALLAVWGVTGIALSVSRPVRGQDVARAERDPISLLALAVLPLAIPGVAAWGGRLALWRLPAANALGWAGVALSALGLWIRVSAMRQLGARFSPLVAMQREHTLERTGWYGFVRHPGYLGSLLASWGAAVAFGSALALPLAATMTVFQLDRMRREEAMLAAHFGDDWREYARQTGALFPRFGPRLRAPEATQEPPKPAPRP